MGEFFKPWRRKIGVVTLVMACVFGAGWVRSVSILDRITIPVGSNTVDGFYSGGGTLTWEHRYSEWDVSDEIVEWETFDLNGIIQQEGPYLIAEEDNAEGLTLTYDCEPDVEPHVDSYMEPQYKWRWHLAGFDIGFESLYVRGLSCSVPYWSFILPLTLLSACLLLSKPRKSAAVPSDGVK